MVKQAWYFEAGKNQAAKSYELNDEEIKNFRTDFVALSKEALARKGMPAERLENPDTPLFSEGEIELRKIYARGVSHLCRKMNILLPWKRNHELPRTLNQVIDYISREDAILNAEAHNSSELFYEDCC